MDYAAIDSSDTLPDTLLDRLLQGEGVAAAIACGGKLTDASPRFSDIFGIPSGSAAGWPLSTIGAEADRMRVLEMIEAASRQRADEGDPPFIKLTFDGLRSDGSVFPAEMIVAARQLTDGPATVLLVTDLSAERTLTVEERFQWTEAEAVGISTIDAQHRELMDLACDLAQCFELGRPREIVAASRDALMAFTLKHFATEERLMHQHPGWPLQAAHEAEHRRLLEDLGSLSTDAEGTDTMVAVTFLHEWLVRHIEEMDRPLGAWLREHAVI